VDDQVKSYVVTGGGQGVGAAIVTRLLASGYVVSLDLSAEPAGHERLRVVTGDAADPDVATLAADVAASLGPLHGWVNNAAVFRDAWLDSAPPLEVVALIERNLAPAVVGCAVAVRRLAPGGSIVNVSSHQASRAVRGALPYATAKAAIEGLTRAVAVDYGPLGLRANAVALGSIATERYTEFLASLPDAARVEAEMAVLHPVGRVGEPAEVADAVAYLLSAPFVNGVTLPVDGGRSARGADPESV
jgi:NAD(P)-dependent dehydrogenase (short-subunit alcohol dehydrogenase family)